MPVGYYLQRSAGADIQASYALPEYTVMAYNGVEFNRSLTQSPGYGFAWEEGDGKPIIKPVTMTIQIFSSTEGAARALMSGIIGEARLCVAILKPSYDATKPNGGQFIIGSSRLGIDPFGEVYRLSVFGLKNVPALRPLNTSTTRFWEFDLVFNASDAFWRDSMSGGQFVF